MGKERRTRAEEGVGGSCGEVVLLPVPWLQQAALLAERWQGMPPA